MLWREFFIGDFFFVGALGRVPASGGPDHQRAKPEAREKSQKRERQKDAAAQKHGERGVCEGGNAAPKHVKDIAHNTKARVLCKRCRAKIKRAQNRARRQGG